ncbi:MAG: hypothetical protein C0594_03000 [Marinilabiliales bacterium]|nr:MAG: hypothetical protein C0594_03000 [Marinilabiliales bacterium]
MKMNRQNAGHFLFIILLFYSFLVSSQQFDPARLSLKEKPGLLLKLDTRNSFVANRSARITGVKVGLNFDNVVKIGAGYNWLKSDISKDLYIADSHVILDTISARLKFRYLSYFAEYAFYRKGNWEFVIPVQLGFGNIFYQYDLAASERNTKKQFSVIYETNLSGHYRFLKYFGIGVGIGYRIMLFGNKTHNTNFNSPIYILKLKVFLGDLAKDLGLTKEKAMGIL